MTKPNYRIIKDYPLHKIGDVWELVEDSDNATYWECENIYKYREFLFRKEINQLVKDGFLEEVNDHVIAGVDFTESIEQLDEIVKKLKLSLHKEYMERLKLTDLKKMQPNTIFATGEKWVAVRGDVEDWAIYKQGSYEAGTWTDEAISERGDKVHDEKQIKRLVPSTRGAYDKYRH